LPVGITRPHPIREASSLGGDQADDDQPGAGLLLVIGFESGNLVASGLDWFRPAHVATDETQPLHGCKMDGFSCAVGRGIKRGRVSLVPTSGGLSILVEDDANPEFWCEVRLTQQQLRSALVESERKAVREAAETLGKPYDLGDTFELPDLPHEGL